MRSKFNHLMLFQNCR